MKRKINFVCFKEAITAPGVFGGERELNTIKTKGLEMWLEPGHVIASYRGNEVGIPLGNVRSWTYDKDIGVCKNRLTA